MRITPARFHAGRAIISSFDFSWVQDQIGDSSGCYPCCVIRSKSSILSGDAVVRPNNIAIAEECECVDQTG